MGVARGQLVVEVHDPGVRRRGFEAELEWCYPPPKKQPKDPPRPPVEKWPAPAWCNPPLQRSEEGITLWISATPLPVARAEADVSLDRGVHAVANALEGAKHAAEHPAPLFDPAAADGLPAWSEIST